MNLKFLYTRNDICNQLQDHVVTSGMTSATTSVVTLFFTSVITSVKYPVEISILDWLFPPVLEKYMVKYVTKNVIHP